MEHETVLMRQKMAGLHMAVEIATEVKSGKMNFPRIAETSTLGEITDLIAEKEWASRKRVEICYRSTDVSCLSECLSELGRQSAHHANIAYIANNPKELYFCQ